MRHSAIVHHINEEDLLLAVSQGSYTMYSKLYDLYLDEVYRYIFLFTKSEEKTEDIVQNTFLKIWEKRCNLVKVRSFRSYVYKVSKNLLIDELRRNQTETKILSLLKLDSEDSLERSDSKVIYGQYYQIIQDAINLLPEKRKQIVIMRLMEDMSLDEIAATLSISKSVVKKQFYSGIDLIKRHLRFNGELPNAVSFITLVLLGSN
ncbi:RNA polymerase sigma factor [Paradesertivirga mongoliensis]|uniref:RNA polymerase sigma factor n=1 Tax=Paradesertivirga mongoliensis TaxID=2100740 RepID=A0ABW4ZQB3_9SPHI|nr:RNA polymerase sigma factor [Pedobacter mongoliensis]